jgi:hypothetical protein
MTDTSNTKTCHVLGNGNIMTPEGVLFYAKYAVEAHENEQGKMVHSLQICFPPNTDLKALKNEMGKVALEALEGDTKSAKNAVEKRFTDPNNKPQGGKPAGDEYEGWTLISATSTTQPDFVWPNGKRMSLEEAKNSINSGDYIRATLNPYWRKVQKNPGVSLGLQNIQLVRKGKPIGYVKPAGEQEFGAVDGAEDFSASTSKDSGASTDVESLFN